MTYEEDFVAEPSQRPEPLWAETPGAASDAEDAQHARRRRDPYDQDASTPVLHVTSGTPTAEPSQWRRRGWSARTGTSPADRRRTDPVEAAPPWEEEDTARPINWCVLGPEEAEREWVRLDAWVYWLRDRFGLTPQEIPPAWHRHDPLVWELSALRSAWLACHAADASPQAPLSWLRDFYDARFRLREWVQDLGTELKQDRPTRKVTWPGEPTVPSPGWETITDRAADFAVHVADDVAAREQALAEAQAAVAVQRAEAEARMLALVRPDLAGSDLHGGF